MKINNLNVKNNSIIIQGIMIDFSEIGIYKISGEVGSGKTSLIEEVMFGKNDIVFQNNTYAKLYKKARYKLFSYVPQSIPQLDIKVGEYILRGNACVEEGEITLLLNKFSIDENVLELKVSELSGGERTKITIISELIKDTPYLFFDEPSNHLDDSSIEVLREILEEIGKIKTVILISHDERLKVKLCGEYVIKNNNVNYIKLNESEGHKNRKIEVTEAIKINYLRIINSVTKNLAHYISVLFLAMILMGLSVYSHFEFVNNYNTENVPSSDSMYIVFNSNYDDVNKRYIQAEKIIIDESKENSVIKLEDVKKISELGDVDAIYIKDLKYLDMLYQKNSNSENTDILLFSCPQMVLREYWDMSSIDLGFSYIYGSLPQDGKNEAVISLRDFNKYYDGVIQNEEDAIGKIILLEIAGKLMEYEVVGISDSDFIILSYDEKNNFGYYKYSDESFEKFFNEQNEYYIEQDAGDTVVDEMMIATKKGKERNVLNYLFEKYPANSYYSRYYVKTWQKSYNNDRFCQILIPNIIISIIFMIIIVLVNRSSLKYNYNLIRSYENYYMDRKKIRRIYRTFTFYQYIICFACILIFNTIYSEFSNLGNIYICINFGIIIVPLVISHLILGRIESR